MVNNTKIKGVQIVDRQVIEDQRGNVQKFWRETEGLGTVAEVYLSTAYPGVVKAWHLHTKMTLRYVCIGGRAMIGLGDLRPDSPTYGVTDRIMLTDSYNLVGGKTTGWQKMLVIPPGVWNGFRGQIGFQGRVTILNLPDIVHDPYEIMRLNPASVLEPSPLYGFDWGEYEVAG